MVGNLTLLYIVLLVGEKLIANYVTSGLGHQRARKVLFTCMVHATISEFSLDKSRFSQEDSLFF